MTLTEIRSILNERKLLLTKSLGQNFLHDRNVVDKIVRLSEIQPDDVTLEIGPGLGPLTDGLLSAGSRVVVIEKDQRLSNFLEEKYSQNAAAPAMIQGDGLAWLKDPNWPIPTPAKWKCVSNLPYSVASPMLVEMALMKEGPELIVATIQLEVAKRIQASAGSRTYGALSALIAWSFNLGDWFKIPSSCFFPAPDVDSACITLIRNPSPLADWSVLPAYHRLIRICFEQRRKQMQKILRNEVSQAQWKEISAISNIEPAERPERISPNQFAILAKWLKDRSDFGKNHIS